ncbi:MAG: hypothetical protein LQ340_003504 [Diploschistes diacapsis]|nr:MAG: hypothetical protein LQ340_003504 [Diploschistes diacapsis]
MTIDADYLVTTTTTVTRAACATTAPQIPSITAAPNARLGEGSPQGITDGGKRDAQLPDYLTSYQPAQVSSACTCLSSTQAQATATITSTATITGSIETVTKYYTTVNTAVVVYYHVGETRIVTSTKCVTYTPV